MSEEVTEQTSRKPTAILVGNKLLQPYLVKMRSNWDFLPNVETIADFQRGLSTGSITNDIQTVIFVDNLYTSDTDLFARVVAQMAPYAMVCVVNYHPENQEMLRGEIADAATRYSFGEGPVYFIPPKGKVRQAFDEAVENYARDSTHDPENAEILANAQGISVQSVVAAEEVTPATDVVKLGDHRGKIIAMTSPKGGCGKSSLAVILSTYIAHASKAAVEQGITDKQARVLIVDLDVRDAQLGFLTGVANPTMLAIFHAGINKDSVEKAVIHSDSLECDLLLAPKKPRHSNEIPTEFFVNLLESLRSMYDFIILDTSVNYLDPLLEKVAYPQADFIFCVTDIVINSMFSMARWISEVTLPKEMGGMGVNQDRVGIVINKFLPDVHMPNDRIRRSAGHIKIMSVVPSNPKLMATAMNLQKMETMLRHKETKAAVSLLGKAVASGTDFPLSDEF